MLSAGLEKNPSLSETAGRGFHMHRSKSAHLPVCSALPTGIPRSAPRQGSRRAAPASRHPVSGPCSLLQTHSLSQPGLAHRELPGVVCAGNLHLSYSPCASEVPPPCLGYPQHVLLALGILLPTAISKRRALKAGRKIANISIIYISNFVCHDNRVSDRAR